eukprot:gb/GEZJ01008469.1/.p1 GENE.gb/GEZJ01008469.1/~~gb/GEZJ01008469.1/.p1  ORF type:complete len:205 (-),score=29.96 gb/GEZJ01008469.1/:246-860(-)
MVKHNNVLPNGHFHKKWQRRVRTWFDQPAKKKARRQARQEKAAKMAPRPTQLLRPAVHCPTIKYNSKVRLGRGFNVEELKEAGISKKMALTIGIAVDHRRTNKSEESFATNVARLKEYRANLIIFPRGSKHLPKNGDSSLEEQAAATQVTGVTMPLVKADKPVEFLPITAEMSSANLHSERRIARNEHKLSGIRIRQKEEKTKK